MATPEQVRVDSKAPSLFISHRHKDEAVVGALVAVLEKAFYVDTGDIRCTSLKGYDLPVGERTSDRLRADILGVELVIGVIGPGTSDSEYVLFELGAAWGADRATFPVLIGKARSKDVPGPLGERNSASLEDESDCHQLVSDIGEKTSLKRRPRSEGQVAGAIRTLAEAARVVAPSEHWSNLLGEPGSDAKDEVSWLNLSVRRDFNMGDRLRLFLGEPLGHQPARRILVRFLCANQNSNEPVGILNAQGFPVPKDGILDVTLTETFLNVRSISVHGGENPWGVLRVGKGNGTPKLIRAAIVDR